MCSVDVGQFATLKQFPHSELQITDSAYSVNATQVVTVL